MASLRDLALARIAVACGGQLPDFAAAPVVSGAFGFTVERWVAEYAARAVALYAPDDIPRLLDMVGIVGSDRPMRHGQHR
jgi:hypothetical protein